MFVTKVFFNVYSNKAKATKAGSINLSPIIVVLALLTYFSSSSFFSSSFPSPSSPSLPSLSFLLLAALLATLPPPTLAAFLGLLASPT